MVIEHISRYLKGTQDIGMILCPNKVDAFNIYVNAYFSENLIKNYAELDQATAKSQSELVVTYANNLIIGLPNCKHR